MTIVIVAVLVAVGLLVALALVLLYNRLVRLRNRSENAWAQVDVQLRRRYDLVPNLVETVRGYAAHERGTFEESDFSETPSEYRTVPSTLAGFAVTVGDAGPPLRCTFGTG